MGVYVIGVLWLLMAAGNALHIGFFLREEFRGTKAGRNFQKRNTLPYAILGVGFVIWGWLNRADPNSTVFCVGLAVISLIPLILLYKNRSKLLEEYREECGK